MPKIHVATSSTSDNRYARRSMEALKDALRGHTDTEWALVTYEVPSNVDALCALIEDPAKVLSGASKEASQAVRIDSAGRVRAATPAS